MKILETVGDLLASNTPYHDWTCIICLYFSLQEKITREMSKTQTWLRPDFMAMRSILLDANHVVDQQPSERLPDAHVDVADEVFHLSYSSCS
jgi:hypothetical protein